MYVSWHGEHVVLRAAEERDLERFPVLTDLAEVRLYGDRIPFPDDAASREQRLRRQFLEPRPGDNVALLIETHEGALVGSLSTDRCDPHAGTLWYGVGIFEAHRRQGFATDAIRVMLRHYFDELRDQKCNAAVHAFNHASGRLHQRLGFVEEGRLRRVIYTMGAHHDEVLFGITREEFFAANPRPAPSPE